MSMSAKFPFRRQASRADDPFHTRKMAAKKIRPPVSRDALSVGQCVGWTRWPDGWRLASAPAAPQTAPQTAVPAGEASAQSWARMQRAAMPAPAVPILAASAGVPIVERTVMPGAAEENPPAIERIMAIARPPIIGPVTRIIVNRSVWSAIAATIAVRKTETRGRICGLGCTQRRACQYQRSESEFGEGFHVSSPLR